MSKKRFWADIAEAWSRREAIIIPDIDIGGQAPPDDLDDDLDLDGLDDFFKDILSDSGEGEGEL